MSAQFYGAATAQVEAEDDGSHATIVIELHNPLVFTAHQPTTADVSLTIEDAARLAEQIDAAIDLMARTARARREAREARITALKAAIAELEAA